MENLRIDLYKQWMELGWQKRLKAMETLTPHQMFECLLNRHGPTEFERIISEFKRM